MLRPFGASVETAPNTGFPYFTPGGFLNSRSFIEGPMALIALPNPFVITRMGEWIVSILLGKSDFSQSRLFHCREGHSFSSML